MRTGVSVTTSNSVVLGANIRILAAYKGLTFSQLAKRSGLTPIAIGNAASGRHQTRLATLEKIAKAIGVNIETLLRTDLINSDAIRN